MWQLFSKVTPRTDAIGRNDKASDRVCFAFIINPTILFHAYDDTHSDANTYPALLVPAVCVIFTLVGV